MKARTLRIISLLTLAAAWEIAGRAGNAHLLPPLSKVVIVWIDLLVSGQLLQALAVSLQALALGFILSVLFGVPLGLLMGRYRRLESFLDIYMTALLTVPMISFIPFLVIAFGLGPMAGVLAIAIHSTGALGKLFSEIVENADMKPVEGVRSTGASWLSCMRFAVLPQVAAGYASYALLRFEINVREA